jgi:hypothetical protein
VSRRWIVAASLLVALVLAGVAVTITGGAIPGAGQLHSSRRSPMVSAVPQAATAAQPAPTPAPPAPPSSGPVLTTDMWSLPSPDHYAGTVGVGFPHTTLGAVALGYGVLTAEVNVNPDISASVVRATALDPSPSKLRQAAEVTKQARVKFGLPPSGPTSATFALSIEACRVEQETPDRVVAGYEGTLVVDGPTVAGQTLNFSKTIALVSNGTDWRVDLNAVAPPPPIAFPGAPGAADQGWHACAEV